MRGTRLNTAGGGRLGRLLVLPILLIACATPSRGIYHVVDRGENLFRIGKAYDVHYLELARLNGIRDPHRIEVGQRIFIPGATRPLPVEIITPRAIEVAIPPETYGRDSGMIWPTREGTLTSRFGRRNGSVHDGIDIAAREGTPIHAVRAGRVIYSDRLPGYGNLVILDHGAGLTTVYAHNSANEVREGQRVSQGQRIARVGRTGRTTGPNLHFEVRVRNVARDPLRYLPPPPAERALR
jgi:lipoprotein NlpD